MIKTLSILILGSTTLFGQKVCATDSLKVAEAYTALFAAIDSDNMESLDNLSTDKIYCMICSESSDFSDSPYLYDKKEFLEHHLNNIKNSESYQRATKSNELILFQEKDHITAFWTIYQANELAPGHEGEQLGIYFKKVNGEYKFAGIETIP